MSQTPTHTPIRSMEGNNKKLPLIVDIAIDHNGKQLYQVHESSKLVRQEMPLSTNFSESNITGPYLDDSYFGKNEEKTPIRRVLGTISPSTLNQKKLAEDSSEDTEEPVSATRKNPLTYYPQQDFLESSSSDVPGVKPEPSIGDDLDQARLARLQQHDDIWSGDVEKAFEEVLSIIPKNGLNKIKISGRSCGRNELISDYILTKTGKFRTRKQVSSHIQVIKNLGQKTQIIRLINEGPVFATEEEHIQNIKRFEEIFSKITLNKSLGFDSTYVTVGPASPSLKRKSTSSLPEDNKRPRARYLLHPPPSLLRSSNSTCPLLDLQFENFFMSIYDSYSVNPIILSIQNNNDEVKKLKVKDNVNMSLRFPGLNEFRNCSHFPIVHNMVKLLFPSNLPVNHSIDEGFKSNYSLNTQSTSDQYSSFICIYSFGKEVLKFNEPECKLNENVSFLSKFWKFMLNRLINKDPNEVGLAFKGMTIKQIVFEKDGDQDDKYHVIQKSKIRAIILWEFAKVSDIKDAIMTTSKLVLPPTRLASGDFVPNMPLKRPSVSSTISAPPSSATFVEQAPFNYPPELEQTWEKPPPLDYRQQVPMQFLHYHHQPPALPQQLVELPYNQYPYQSPVSANVTQQPLHAQIPVYPHGLAPAANANLYPNNIPTPVSAATYGQPHFNPPNPDFIVPTESQEFVMGNIGYSDGFINDFS